MSKLSKRLESLALLVDKKDQLVDVGCDHGLLSIYLVQNNLCKKVIASDVNQNALNSAIKNIREIMDLFLEKAPRNIEITKIEEHIKSIDGILDVHHIHIWSMDGQKNYATLHIVTDSEPHKIKEKIRTELCELGIIHVTIELETGEECCHEKRCNTESNIGASHVHHHHHHSH